MFTPARNHGLVPTVTKRSGNVERAFDIYSRLLDDRIIFLDEQFHDGMASLVCAQLLHLANEDPHTDIQIFINSPGGVITSGMAIYDTMQFIQPDVSTICIGLAASMGSFILMGGAPGKRYCLPNSKVMIHQPSGGFQGQASDIEIAARNILETKQRMYELYARHCGQDTAFWEGKCDRDCWLWAEQALELGLIDKIVDKAPTRS